jgi:hypothetical protein
MPRIFGNRRRTIPRILFDRTVQALAAGRRVALSRDCVVRIGDRAEARPSESSVSLQQVFGQGLRTGLVEQSTLQDDVIGDVARKTDYSPRKQPHSPRPILLKLASSHLVFV